MKIRVFTGTYSIATIFERDVNDFLAKVGDNIHDIKIVITDTNVLVATVIYREF